MLYETGDEITLFKSGHTPLVLRKRDIGWEMFRYRDHYGTRYWNTLPQSDDVIGQQILEYKVKPENYEEPVPLSEVGKLF